MYKDLCLAYFKAFSEKDINQLQTFFNENISLADWEISAQGKSEVVAANQKIFDSVESIHVSPTALYEDQNTVIAELDVIVNDQDTLKVVDIIQFSEQNEILSITAYKR